MGRTRELGGVLLERRREMAGWAWGRGIPKHEEAEATPVTGRHLYVVSSRACSGSRVSVPWLVQVMPLDLLPTFDGT